MKIINPGKVFEQEIKNSIPNDFYYHRIKDTSQSFGNSSTYTRFSSHNECDLFLYKKPFLYAIELKSTSGTSFSFSIENNNKMIKEFQILSLRNMSTYGIIAGFIFNFRKSEHTYWLDIFGFDKFLCSTEKKSINEKDVVLCGGVLIPQVKKRIRYTYDLLSVLENPQVIGGK